MPSTVPTTTLYTFGNPSKKDISAAKQYLSQIYNDTPVAIWYIPNHLEAREKASDAACLCTAPALVCGLVFWPILPCALASICGTYAWTKRNEEIKRTLYVQGGNDGTLYKMKREVSKGLCSFGLKGGEWRGGILVTGKELMNSGKNNYTSVPQPQGITIASNSYRGGNRYWKVDRVYYVEVGSPNVALYVGNEGDLQRTYNLLLGNAVQSNVGRYNTTSNGPTNNQLVNDSANNSYNVNTHNNVNTVRASDVNHSHTIYTPNHQVAVVTVGKPITGMTPAQHNNARKSRNSNKA